jgi:hypothetical protein
MRNARAIKRWEDMWMIIDFTKGPRTRHIGRVLERDRAELPQATTSGFLTFSGSQLSASKKESAA